MLENVTADRYVKRVSANPEMSHNKLLARIRPESEVLEFGPASGAMTEVLAEGLQCSVSIVEIDEKCFEHAMNFAVDGICSDIESLEWENKFAGKKFDYVIFADVLEHLRNPRGILEQVRKFIKEDGSVLISVPNIAHNSVIIQLLKNHFIYQSTGILDLTHIHHFTFSELQTTCMEAGYAVTYMDAVYIAVGKNEFPDTYADIDPMIAAALKQRPLGEVYQHIVEIKREEYVKQNEIKIENCIGKPAVYTDTIIEELIGNSDIDDRRRVLKILSDNPNVFFENNSEISRMRKEINDLYAANETEDQYFLIQRVGELQEEEKVKNHYIEQLQKEIEEKDRRIVELQDAEEERNNHIRKLDKEIAEKNHYIECLPKVKQSIYGLQKETTKEIRGVVEAIRRLWHKE